MAGLGRVLITFGCTLFGLGLLLMLLEKVGWRLPGDFVFRGRNWTFYLPLGTSVLLSALLTLLLWLFSRR
ncbi:MAG: DUF2905 family protein [Thermoanaerobaculaceae bacterium]